MRKETFIIVRVEIPMKDKLIKLAGGSRKLSAFIRIILEKSINKKTN